MTIYDYPKPDSNGGPDLDAIEIDIAASAMTNKTVDFMRWDQDGETLKIAFEVALSAGDKDILDAIVAVY